MLNRKRITLALLILLIVITTLWLVISIDKIHVSPNKQRNPDAFMSGAEITKIDAMGHPNMKLTAPSLTMYRESNITNMTNPVVRVKNDVARWKITAQTGTAYNHPQKIIFKGNVIIRKYTKNQKPMIIKTTQITIYPQKSLAKTDKPVTIIQGKNIIHGIGLLANLNTGSAQILSNIRERYTPNN